MDNMSAAYKRALEIYKAGKNKSILNEDINEHWCVGSKDFWFIKDTENQEKVIGKEFTRFSFSQGKTVLLFNHEEMAALLLSAFSIKVNSFDLPFNVNEVNDSQNTIYLDVFGIGECVYSFSDNLIKKLKYPLFNSAESTSPNKEYSLYIENHNIFIRNNLNGKISQLTCDGEQGLDYSVLNPVNSNSYLYDNPPPIKPSIVWAPDSKHFLTYRSDTRYINILPLLQSVPLNGKPRALQIPNPFPFPGDEHIYEGILFLGSVDSMSVKPVIEDNKPLSVNFAGMVGLLHTKWTLDGTGACFIKIDRFFKHFRCLILDVPLGTVRTVIDDEYKTFGFVNQYDGATYHGAPDFSLEYSNVTNEIVWRSETEGWSAFYLYDSVSGKLKRKLTQGEWSARSIKYFDPINRFLYFTGAGLEEGVDPYYQFLYRVCLDTGEIKKLTNEIAEHFISFPPCGEYYIDTFSTVDSAPQTVVNYIDNRQKCSICSADLSRIFKAGFNFPETFQTLARDGKTMLYGIIVKPYNFDPAKKYPVIDYIYGGSSHINTPKAFAFSDRNITDPLCGLHSLAQLGFVGIIVDGLATPLRSKKIHDVVYEHPEECCGLDDHVASIKQLSERFSWIDIDRVGIWGFSGGGYATARALLAFPKFYKVGFSVCGNHDLSAYRADYVECWMGEYDNLKFSKQANYTIAKNLKGHLMLVQGDMDVNVHPSNTLRLASALIEANKDFDLLIYPNAGHILAFLPYVIRKRWDYFTRYLLNEEPPRNFDLS